VGFRNVTFLENNSECREGVKPSTRKLDEVTASLDAIRDAAFVRPSTYIADLIRKHDERAIQNTLAL